MRRKYKAIIKSISKYFKQKSILITFSIPLIFLSEICLSYSKIPKSIEAIYSEMINNHKNNQIITGQNIKIITYNLGLLNLPLLRITEPEFVQRSNKLFEFFSLYLNNEKPHIVFLQELWHEDDFKTILKVAKLHNYTPALNKAPAIEKEAAHGLQILIKSNLIEKNDPKTNFKKFESQGFREWLTSIQRGYLIVEFTGLGNKVIKIFNTHLSPYPTFNPNASEKDILKSNRVQQAVELGKEVNKAIKNLDFVVTAGDFNSGAEIGGLTSDHNEREWFSDFHPYEKFINYSNKYNSMSNCLIDTFRVANPKSPGHTQVQENPIAKRSPNSGGEPDQRLDYIFIGGNSKFKVLESRLIFVTKPMSDHYAIQSKIRIEQRKRK